MESSALGLEEGPVQFVDLQEACFCSFPSLLPSLLAVSLLISLFVSGRNKQKELKFNFWFCSDLAASVEGWLGGLGVQQVKI